MLHDDALAYLRKRLTSKTLVDGIAPIYTKYDDFIDQNFIDTSYDFFANGHLDLPFEDCLFLIRDAITPPPDLNVNIPQNLLQDLTTRIVFATRNKSIIDIVASSGEWKEKAGEIEPNFVFMQVGIAKKIGLSYFAAGVTNKKLSLIGTPLIAVSPMDVKRKDAEENAGAAIRDVLCSIMLLNVKSSTIDHIEIAENLNRRRKICGKPLLRGYINVSATRTESGESVSGGYKMTPHWRRGHIRRLGDQIIPVKPCIVNFNGTSPSKKVYERK